MPCYSKHHKLHTTNKTAPKKYRRATVAQPTTIFNEENNDNDDEWRINKQTNESADECMVHVKQWQITERKLDSKSDRERTELYEANTQWARQLKMRHTHTLTQRHRHTWERQSIAVSCIFVVVPVVFNVLPYSFSCVSSIANRFFSFFSCFFLSKNMKESHKMLGDTGCLWLV